MLYTIQCFQNYCFKHIAKLLLLLFLEYVRSSVRLVGLGLDLGYWIHVDGYDAVILQLCALCLDS